MFWQGIYLLWSIVFCNFNLFSKTCEDVRRYVDIRLIKDEKMAEKKLSHFSFKRHKLYGEDLLAVEMRKLEVTLDKPRYVCWICLSLNFWILRCRYVGASVLNLAKVIMYDYHYNFIMKKFPTAQLLFTDTGKLF